MSEKFIKFFQKYDVEFLKISKSINIKLAVDLFNYLLFINFCLKNVVELF